MRECFLVFLRCLTERSCLVLLMLMLYGVSDSLSSDFEPGGRPQIKVINPDAEVIIGTVLNIRERGPGLFGCGERRHEGVIKADALKWMVDELNKKLWSGQSANVSFGLYLMDSCDRMRTATSQLIDFLPELQSDRKLEEALPFKLAIIDDVDLNHEPDIEKSLDEINFPVLKTNLMENSPESLADAIFRFLQELHWERFAIIHSSSMYGSGVLKQLTKGIKKSHFCVPWILNIDVTGYQQQLQAVFESGIPVVSLLSTEEHDSFLESLPKSGFRHEVPILFADSMTRSQLKAVPGNSFRIFAVVPSPEKEVTFENYYAKNSIGSGLRTEDELDLIERTKIVRKIKAIGDKLSQMLRDAIENVCRDRERICSKLSSPQGRNALMELLAKSTWSNDNFRHQLVEYQFRFSDGHVHLHKVMGYNEFKNMEVFENNISFPEVNCDDAEADSGLECRCLEMKADRTESARNLNDWSTKNSRPYKNGLPTDKNSSENKIEDVFEFLHKPMVFGSLNDPLNGTLACLTLLGGLITLIIGQYFATFAALPNGGLTSGTSVIGYVILMELFLLYSSNLAFLLTPLVSTCIVRRFAVNVSYAAVFSGMLIKVWYSMREVNSEQIKSQKPWRLLSYSAAFTGFQVLMSGLWLFLKPPATEFKRDKWICYPPDGLDSHLILSMIYPFLLLAATIVLAIRTSSKSNNNETRWILISSSLVAIILSCWAVAIGTGVWQDHRTPCTNLAAATIILLCLYIPKIKMHSKLKKNLKAQANIPPALPEIDKECPVYTTRPSSQFPVVFGYNMMTPPPVIPEEVVDPNYINQSYSLDESTETASTPFESSSYSELDQEPYTFSTFLENPQVPKRGQEDLLNDPTQMIPSSLYPLDMFNIDPIAITSDHCQPGTNEFTPPHRATSQLYLCPQTEWVP